MNKNLLLKIHKEVQEASNRHHDMAIRFIVCNDGTTYHVGQGINLTEKHDVSLNECAEMVCCIVFPQDDDVRTIEIHGRGPNPGDVIHLRYAIPFSDIVQIGYYNSEEYENKLVEIWPHMAKLKED